MTTEQNTNKIRKRKTVLLSKDDLNCIKQHAKQYNTFFEFAEAVQIDRSTLARAIELKRCNQDTYEALIAKQIIIKAAA